MDCRKRTGWLVCALIGLLYGNSMQAAEPEPPCSSAVLQPGIFRSYIESFNQLDEELSKELYTPETAAWQFLEKNLLFQPLYIPNDGAWRFLEENIPYFACPDEDFESTYYYRWWTFRKHIKKTPDGFVITEFAEPVMWGGKYNTICCAAGHHMREGRWLHDPRFLDDYTVFWFRRGGDPRTYSFWAADSVWARFKVTNDDRIPKDILPELVENYRAWEKRNRGDNGLFWQRDGNDGMELSIGDSGYRATINSYMYGDATAIAKIAELAGQAELAETYRKKAATLQRLVQEKLWDEDAKFFKVLPREEPSKLVDVRELHGYTPWYFNLPDADKSVAWQQLMDPQGFYAPFGPTTAEQRHPKFKLPWSPDQCQWDGPSWPFSTAVTLTGMANLLNNYQQDIVSRKDYFDILKIYTKSHRLTCKEGKTSHQFACWKGKTVPWIDEYLNPRTGEWNIQKRIELSIIRGKDYNHSTYCDLIITGLVGLRPRVDDTVEVNPLLPDGTWDWFCLDHILYHGHILTILYDRTGEHYNRGKGLVVLADGKPIASSESLQRVTAKLPAHKTHPGQ